MGINNRSDTSELAFLFRVAIECSEAIEQLEQRHAAFVEAMRAEMDAIKRDVERDRAMAIDQQVNALCLELGVPAPPASPPR